MRKGISASIEIGARSFCGSNGIEGYRLWFTDRAPAAARPTVWPSGALFATASTPMLPPAPGRFSTTTGWPSFSLILGAMERAIRSALPPGGKLTMKRIGFDGHVCACATSINTRNRKGVRANFLKQKLMR